MAGRSALRGSKAGAGSGGEVERGPAAPGHQISYWCGRGHETSPWFAEEAQAPSLWDCRRCGCPAGRDPANPPGTARALVGRTHLSHVQERRTDAEAEALLQEALTKLRQSSAADRLRRGQLLHHIISHVGAATDTDSMMDSVLWALIHALGAEGAAVIGAVSAEGAIEVLHECGPGASAVLEAAAPLVVRPTSEPSHTANPDGRMVLAVGCQTRFSARAGLAIWRAADARPWDREDTILAGSAVCIVRMILDYDGLQREVVHQARTDPLTGLLNRRAFIEEMHRELARLDRDGEAGTLMFVDLDAFKAVNDRLGNEMGDKILIRLADILRALRGHLRPEPSAAAPAEEG